MRTPALALSAALAAALALPLPAVADGGGKDHSPCTIELGPDERFEQDRTAEVRPGEQIGKVTSLRGDVVLRAGAIVDQAVALGGSVVLEPGARVRHHVIALGGDVRLERDARVEESAIAVGGQLKLARGARVEGKTASLAIQLDGSSLAAIIADGMDELRRCEVVERRAARAGPEGGGAARR